MSEQLIHKYFAQITSAIEFIHNKNLIHRDIKPENILLDSNFNIKLCDFGWSAESSPYENRVTFCGTLEYMSPEILRGEPQDFSVDIWALGILLYEMFHKRPPYSGRTPSEMMRSIRDINVTFSKHVPHEARDLMLRVLRKDQTKRLSIREIIYHAFLRKYGNVFSIENNREDILSSDRHEHNYNFKNQKKVDEFSKTGPV